ncbi:peptidoglycan/xylan/chitin deacetylase (PgdA/CDA1 family) [Arthrobacter sp. PvP102]|uniref:polysaccharide deacetylase family protein n=1 Tax=unclassified Arthrobacter TaxID=235627 RepID=UPI001AE2730A|nr:MULTISPECIES: polysaccharide deacetylase family protein [unclassified Arthrobacter]MBP1233895.1 peptidoglycan/xylan/chitin deacetylase (PgdA/CDA1 family) [Arthrobacter sp. PvP103]MBP1239029.1 peptidoglycan/xylan/chitin deacetylase (PgdA/CDA1 family) [Arthrobacter sp. PvP102]
MAGQPPLEPPLEPPLDPRRRRLAAGALVAAAVIAAVVLAVILAGAPRGTDPQSGPPPESGASSSSATAPPSTPATAVPGVPGSSEPPPSPAPETPGESTAPAPVAPGPTPPPETLPVPQPPPPAAPFPAGLAGQDVELVPGAGPSVALTFDAGANSAGLPSILQTLESAGVRGTFFLTGAWAAANPAGVAAIVAGGHRVGNHSQTHPDFTGLPDAGIVDQVRAAEQSIVAAGADPRPLFRFPFGARDTRTIAAVNNLGYVPVRWSVDTLGWKGTSGGITAQLVADRALSALQPGEIVLMHIGSNPDDGSTLDADALPQMIERMRQAGYGFVTLDSLLAG